MSLPEDRYDFRWTRRQCATWLVLCVVAAAALTAASASGRVPADRASLGAPQRLADTEQRLDPNTASAAALDCLPGIGPAKARAIVAHRQTATARFGRPEDLARVHGIGPVLVARMTPYLTFD